MQRRLENMKEKKKKTEESEENKWAINIDRGMLMYV